MTADVTSTWNVFRFSMTELEAPAILGNPAFLVIENAEVRQHDMLCMCHAQHAGSSQVGPFLGWLDRFTETPNVPNRSVRYLTYRQNCKRETMCLVRLIATISDHHSSSSLSSSSRRRCCCRGRVVVVAVVVIWRSLFYRTLKQHSCSLLMSN